MSTMSGLSAAAVLFAVLACFPPLPGGATWPREVAGRGAALTGGGNGYRSAGGASDRAPNGGPKRYPWRQALAVHGPRLAGGLSAYDGLTLRVMFAGGGRRPATEATGVVSHPAAAPPAGMAFPGEAWEEATPESQGVDPARLREAVGHLAGHCGRDGVRQLVIVRNGRVIWKGDDVDHVHGVWSVTKSFTGTCLGLLVADGKCSPDTPAADHLPALRARYPSLTLRHFAAMTSGYRAAGDEPQGGYVHGPSRTPFEPGEPLFEPGRKYAYWDSAMNQFGRVLTRVAGEPLEELFRRRVAGPIGMDPAGWDWGDWGEVDGVVVNGGAGNHDKHVRVSARELARFGHLFLNRGNWAGRRVLEPEWVDAVTRVAVPADAPLAQPESKIDGRGVYGLNWWVNGTGPGGARKWPAAPAGTFAAVGFNNNHCFVVPEWRMVVVRLGTDGNVGDDVWDGFFRRLSAGLAG